MRIGMTGTNIVFPNVSGKAPDKKINQLAIKIDTLGSIIE
jgi:hypothetical protein